MTATKMREPVPEFVSMDEKQANRLAVQIVKEGPYIVKPHTNSAGVTVLNVIDSRDGDPKQDGPWTIHDSQEWDDVRPNARRRS